MNESIKKFISTTKKDQIFDTNFPFHGLLYEYKSSKDGLYFF